MDKKLALLFVAGIFLVLTLSMALALNNGNNGNHNPMQDLHNKKSNSSVNEPKNKTAIKEARGHFKEALKVCRESYKEELKVCKEEFKENKESCGQYKCKPRKNETWVNGSCISG